MFKVLAGVVPAVALLGLAACSAPLLLAVPPTAQPPTPVTTDGSDGWSSGPTAASTAST